jgi:flagellar hook assembly protein FlgD
MEYSIPVTTDLTLTVYNLLGQEVYTYNRENIEPGWYRFTWRGTDLSGREVSSGVYIYQLKATGFISNKKMLFIK